MPEACRKNIMLDTLFACFYRSATRLVASNIVERTASRRADRTKIALKIMAPNTKRKIEEEFILTLSDKESELSEEETSSAHPPTKKHRTNDSLKSKKVRNPKKPKKQSHASQVEENEGIWGLKDEDDGAMDSEFEFQLEDGIKGDLDDFKEWGFEHVQKSLSVNGNVSDKRMVDIDDIILRRREKNQVKGVPPVETLSEDEIAKQEIMKPVEEYELLNEDGFGMGVGSDVEESADEIESETQIDSDGDDSSEAPEQESEASPAPHPDDLDSEEDSSNENDENSEEAARSKAFFAPEEAPTHGAKSVSETLTFQSMSLSRPILRGLSAVGFTKPTPIQAKAIPVALLGKDIVGGAVTGSGKTAAFIVPILERLLYRPKKVPTSRVAILLPTRELAIQCHAVAVKIASFTDIKFCLAVGGLSLKAQEKELRLRPDVIIATPGRFIDHMRNSVSFTIDTLEILVLDEADRMLEAGFADELDEIVKTIPKSRQTMLFSATMNSSVDHLIRIGLQRPARLLVDSQKQTVKTLVQEFIRLRPGRESKRMGYLLYLCKNVYVDRTIIFFRQKKEAHRARIIFSLSGLKASELHGSMSQEQRILSVESFRNGKVSFLLATDLASRGLDIKGVDTVINYEAPQSHEIYLHRVGRTARAGRQGKACTLAAETDRKVVKAAVKTGRTQGAKIVSRVIDATEADKWADKVEKMKDEIEEILVDEKEEKQLAQVEMQVRKGENIILHQDEIQGRPKRTWFESEQEKMAAKRAGKMELNKTSELSGTKSGKLSNKKKKLLDDRDVRQEGKVWKKGKAEREGKVRKKRPEGKPMKKSKKR